MQIRLFCDFQTMWSSFLILTFVIRYFNFYVLGPTNNNNQVSPLLFNNNNAQQVSAGYSVNNNNGVSNTNAQQVNQAYTSITGNSNSNQFSPIINNNALQTNSPLNNRGNNNLVNNALQVNTNVDSNTVTNQQLNALNSFINNNDISNQANPFLTNSEKLILQESRQQQVNFQFTNATIWYWIIHAHKFHILSLFRVGISINFKDRDNAGVTLHWTICLKTYSWGMKLSLIFWIGHPNIH